MWRKLACALVLSVALPAHAESSDDRIGPADLARLADVAEPDFSVDGEYLVYSVTTSNVGEDTRQSDLWRVRYDGRDRVQLTHTPTHDESRPLWSPDGRSIAFLSDRGGEDAKTQVWLMPASGGDARRLTDFPEGVEDFAWAPGGKRLAVIAWDPERPPGTAKPRNPPPVVTDRYWFKQDETGYLGARRKHLYVVDFATGKSELLTPGEHDEQLPAWSPDGRYIAYVTKRGADPDRHLNFDIYLVEPRAGAEERRLTSFAGADLDPEWETRPAWSPDGKRIAYLQGGEDKWVYYSPYQLAVIDVATGEATLPAPIDRCFSKPRWARDGRSIYALIEQSRVTHLSRVALGSGRVTALTVGPRFDVDFALAADRIVVLGGDDHHPYELFAVESGGLRPLTAHNEWLKGKRLAAVEDISFKSADGTGVEGFLVKPLDYEPGHRYPTILRIHGGPVYQFSHEFMMDWQAYAASGYVVVAANPRGSSGRGFDFSRAIYADWGDRDVLDVLAAVDHVVALSVADPARLGVGGRSYGGILTNYVIASDQRFKAAVSGAGSSNVLGLYGHDQYVREYDLELGVPWRNQQTWERLSYPFLHADRIVTPTLFYCAEKDFNVPCLGAEQMYQALRTRDVPTRLV
ncbi:MAG: DNA-dirted polymerase, partial [Acidobacteria bacterium]|nr:DNA-dirted polymerase [Acidobacteriota bacterium]